MGTIFFTYIKESVRKKLLQLIFILTLVYLIVFYLIGHFGLKDISSSSQTGQLANFSTMVVSTLGFYFSTMIISFFTIMTAVGIVSSEIESGVIHSVLTRPIKRSSYLIGKYLSLSFLVSLYTLFVYFSIVILSKIIGLTTFDKLPIYKIILGGLIYMLIPIAIISLCIFGNSYFKTISNGVFVFTIYILGTIGSIMEQFGVFFNKNSLINIGIVSSLIAPFESIYKIMLSTALKDANIANTIFGLNFLQSLQPSIWMDIYILIYIFGLLFIAIRKFNKMDL